MTNEEIQGQRFNTYNDANEVRCHLQGVDWEADWAIMHGAEGYRLELMPASFPPPPVGDVIELTPAMEILES
jgi:hypothetical protein